MKPFNIYGIDFKIDDSSPINRICHLQEGVNFRGGCKAFAIFICETVIERISNRRR